ncbi:MAG: DUF6090 family protein [Cyclobacteriaceae bacterium]
MIENKKVGTYLLYAVGEIFLVVVGILIALQVNDWDDNRKKEKKVDSYKLFLLKDLQQDSIAMLDFLSNVEAGQKEFEAFQKRLTAPSANLDTVYKIARYEATLLADRVRPFNTNTFSALTSTGDISLLPKQLTNLMFTLKRDQELIIELGDLTYQKFWSATSEFSYRLPQKNEISLINSGPINDHFWETIKKEEVAILLNKLVSAKQNHYRISKLILTQIQQQTYNLMNELRKQK